ncbi:hypothetical protein CISG_10180 [Coccidioides immitis RMSCC 3703]|uniref:Uncharacterized protein n=1 Tax=Coccidioides immitis RMSCC 3703 TaxID=454286 RepID=A0A0J8QN64_COCIT|nr:hypothetical protein CISG_10180 [Coccidioides immitis RMSCC 3703]
MIPAAPRISPEDSKRVEQQHNATVGQADRYGASTAMESGGLVSFRRGESLTGGQRELGEGSATDLGEQRIDGWAEQGNMIRRSKGDLRRFAGDWAWRTEICQLRKPQGSQLAGALGPSGLQRTDKPLGRSVT